MKSVEEVQQFLLDLLNAKELEEADLLSIKDVIQEYEENFIGSYRCKYPNNCFLDYHGFANTLCPECVEEDVNEYRENIIERSKNHFNNTDCPYPNICPMNDEDNFCPECGKNNK